tara:strand:- start:777 stop:920 length:144 start_codon:yes stop_codon:yes gene_type:complete
MKINITYLSALDNISVSNLPIPLSYSCSEISNISGADIILEYIDDSK